MFVMRMFFDDICLGVSGRERRIPFISTCHHPCVHFTSSRLGSPAPLLFAESEWAQTAAIGEQG
jgi:hypothetical protein